MTLARKLASEQQRVDSPSEPSVHTFEKILPIDKYAHTFCHRHIVGPERLLNWLWGEWPRRWAELPMKRLPGTGTSWGVEVTQHPRGASSLLKLQMLVGSVFGFLVVVMIGVASADDIPTSDPAMPEVELVPAVVVAAGIDSINTNSIARLEATWSGGVQNGTAFQLDDGRIGTVTHAVLGASGIELRHGTNVDEIDLSTRTSSRLHDLTTISGDLLGAQMPAAATPSAIGDSVALGGVPDSGRIEVLTGEIIDRTDGVSYGIGRPDVYVIDATVEVGWSGGPVVNAEGEVIAVIVASERVTGVTLAVPIEYLPLP